LTAAILVGVDLDSDLIAALADSLTRGLIS